MNKDYYERLARAYFRGRAARTGQADAGVQDPKLYYFKRGHEELPRVRKTLGFCVRFSRRTFWMWGAAEEYFFFLFWKRFHGWRSRRLTCWRTGRSFCRI